MRILFLACLKKNKNGNNYGGAEKSIIKLANWIADNQKDAEVHLISVEGGEKAFDVSNNVKFYGTRQYSGKIKTHLQMMMETWNNVLKIKPDVIVGFWIHPLFYALPIKLIYNFSMIYSARNDPSVGYGIVARFMRWFVTRKCNGCVFQTHDAMDFFSEDIKKKSKVIFNPTYIKYDDYPLPKTRRDVIVNVGRLSKQKNQELLIKSFGLVHNIYPEMKLEIYGEGELHYELQSLIGELGLDRYVFLKGTTPDVVDRIYGARLFVMSSDYEGMPNALIEAMCVGTPVISTDCPCGGPRELIKDGVNGYLVPVGNVEELAKKILKVLQYDNDGCAIKGKEVCNSLDENKIFYLWFKFIGEIKYDK